MEGVKLNFRLWVIGLIVLVLVIATGGKLYSMQIVNGVAWAEKSEKSIVRTYTVPAARGGVFDRYGRPLVTNSLSYKVTIDEWRLRREADMSWPLLELISICQLSGQSYNDSFPVTYFPYAYRPMSESQKSRFDRFLKKLEWDAEIGAEDLVLALAGYFKLPEELESRDLRRALGVLYEVELRIQVPTVPPYTFAEDLSVELVGVIKEAGLPGVNVDMVAVREYRTNYAAHILGRIGQIPEDRFDEFKEKGYASDEIVGIDGVEQAFEDWLHGSAGAKTVVTNKAGKVQSVINKTEAKPGSNVFLSIDIRLQEEVERLLEANIIRMQNESPPLKGREAQAGSVVVLDVNTGEILAMASYPSFSLKRFMAEYSDLQEDPLVPHLNRSIAGVYSPGSTYKMVTAAAGLESGVINPNSRITDRGAYAYYKDYQPKCHIFPGSHGSLNVAQAIQKSCNYFFYDVGRQSGIEKQGYWARQFGLGEPTGVEIRGERTGYVAGPETSEALGLQWYAGLTLAAAIGQSDNAFTPLQLAGYTATIANGGVLYRPHLLREVKSGDFGQTIYEQRPDPTRRLEVQPSTIEAIQRGMRMVVQPGGTASSVFGAYKVPVAAKTGSVQTSKTTPNNGVFVAYAPYDKPEVAVAVVIEKGGGGSLVAPVARDAFDSYFAIQKEMRSTIRENTLQR